MGTTLRELLELAGGMSRGEDAEVLDAGRFLDAAVHGRSTSTSRWTSRRAVKAGSMNGTSAVMIFDEDDCRSVRRS